MSDEAKERHCKSCDKLLIDEKIFCKRCFLEKRNKAGQLGGSLAAIYTLMRGATALINDNADGEDDTVT